MEEGATKGDRGRAVERPPSASREQNAPEKSSGRTVSCTFRLKLRRARASTAARGVMQTMVWTDEEILPWLPAEDQE